MREIRFLLLNSFQTRKSFYQGSMAQSLGPPVLKDVRIYDDKVKENVMMRVWGVMTSMQDRHEDWGEETHDDQGVRV